MPPLRVLICEDSRTYAAVLKRALEHDGDIEVAAIEPTAEAAIERLRSGVADLVTMDIELPGMSGLAAVEQIMGSAPCPILIVSSHLGPNAERTASALAAGALDAVAKEGLDLLQPSSASATALRARVRQLSHVRVIRHPRARLRPGTASGERRARAAVIGVCASTGGPQALTAVLSRLPGTYAVPVVVVQHISTGFTDGLARWLDATIALPVALATAGHSLAPGVWIAPEGAHLQLARNGAFLADHVTPAGLHQPSGDVLLQSLATVAGGRAVAVVLSGMGRDGVTGARAVHEAGGTVLAQDEESSAVYGMPKAAAAEAGAAVLSLEEIGEALAALGAEELRVTARTALLAQVAAAVRVRCGVALREVQFDSLEAAIARAGVDVEGELAELLRLGSATLDRVIDEVTVKETTFLRDRSQLEAIDWPRLHRLAVQRGDGTIRLWSAGCATGEEAYTLALLACEAFPHQVPPVRVTGSDLSANALAVARRGHYRERALREVDQELRERYFTAEHDGFTVSERLVALCRFIPHNLVADPYPFATDELPQVVVCRNVFIYFEQQTVDRVVGQLRGAVPLGGLMIIGAPDALSGSRPHPSIYRAQAPDPSAIERPPARALATRSSDRPPHRQPTPRRASAERPAPTVRPPEDRRIAAALHAADAGRREEALTIADAVLSDEPLDPDALFLRGFVLLACGEAAEAVRWLRAAVYADPTFGLAAFMLGRAQEANGQRREARRAYEQTLRVTELGDRRHDYLLAEVGLDDIAAACQARLAAAS